MIKNYLNEIPKTYKRTSIFSDLQLFAESDYPCCEIDIGKYKSAASALGAYRASIRRFGMPLKAHLFDGNLYLLKLTEGE